MKKGIIFTTVFLIIIVAFIAGGQIFTVRNVNVVFYNRTGLTTETEVIDIVGLDRRNNIFSVNERAVKQKVAKAFPDNSIYVTDVERSFPDSVTIYVKERALIFKVKVYSPTGANRYVPTDKDFQRGVVYDEGDPALDRKLIAVNNVEVYSSFDTEEFVVLRAIVKVLLECGFEEEALPYFISAIDFTDYGLAMHIVGTDALFRVGFNVDKDSLSAALNEYSSLSETERVDKIINVGFTA